MNAKIGEITSSLKNLPLTVSMYLHIFSLIFSCSASKVFVAAQLLTFWLVDKSVIS